MIHDHHVLAHLARGAGEPAEARDNALLARAALRERRAFVGLGAAAAPGARGDEARRPRAARAAGDGPRPLDPRRDKETPDETPHRAPRDRRPPRHAGHRRRRPAAHARGRPEVPRGGEGPGALSSTARRRCSRARGCGRARPRRSPPTAWGGPEPKETAALASGSFDAQAEVLDSYPEDATVAVFGHEPWVSRAARAAPRHARGRAADLQEGRGRARRRTRPARRRRLARLVPAAEAAAEAGLTMGGPRTPDEILAFYALGLEQGRLDADYFPLERARTQELVLRHIAPPPGVVLDVGGAAGAYAFWLADAGYEVHLVDPVPLHVEQALAASNARASRGLASAQVADARSLPFADASADAVLMLGPLYHLTAREDRLRALGEALRVLRPGGARLRGSHLALRLARGRPARVALRRPGLRERRRARPRGRPAPQRHGGRPLLHDGVLPPPGRARRGDRRLGPHARGSLRRRRTRRDDAGLRPALGRSRQAASACSRSCAQWRPSRHSSA